MKNAKINGRKFLSLFLSVLMVVGTLVTLVPTTVMAATDALVLLPGDLNATSVGSGVANLDPAFVDGGKTYLKIDPVNAQNNGVSVLCTLDEAYDAASYNYVKIGFKANVSTASGAFRFLVSDAGGTAKLKKDVSYWSETKTEITEDDIIVDISSNTQELQYFNILPFAGQIATAIEGTGEVYFNVRYVAFFETEAEATAFDFDEYISSGDGETVADGVAFLDENSNTISVVPVDGSTTINEILAGTSAEVEAVKNAMVRTDTKAFAGWTLTDGTAVDDSTEITESTTLKATYSAYKLFDASALMVEDDEGRLVPKNSKASLAPIVDNGDDCYIVKQGTLGRAAWLYWSFDTNDILLADDVEAVITKFKTNSHDKTPPTSTGLRLVDSNLAFASPVTILTYDFPTQAGSDGLYEVNAVFEIPDDYTPTTINGFGIGPWNGQYLPDVDTSAGEAYSDFYAAYEYVAVLEKASAVEYFEYSADSEEEEDNTVDLVDCHVFEADEITGSAAGYFADGLTTVDGVKYYRFTGPEEEYEYTRSFYGIINVPEDVNAHKYHYAVIGYRTNITDTASVSVGLLPTDGAAYKRFWGLYSDLNGSNGAMVVDIAAINAGEVTVTDFGTSIDVNSNVKYLRVGPHKTYGSTHVANEYLDIEYIGFFKNKVSADAYAESRIPEVLPELDMDIDSPYHIFLANQLAGKTNGHTDNGIIDENNSQYLSYSGPVGGATYTGNEYVQFSFPKQIHAQTYKYVAVGYKSNIELPAGTPTAVSSAVAIDGTVKRIMGFTGELISSEQNEKMIVDLTTKDDYNGCDYESPISYFRIALYGGRAQFDKAYMAEDDYFDIEYIGFFKTLEAAQAYEFDYEAELKNLEKNYGDANGDGKATTVDSVILMRQLAGWTGYETLAKPKNLDVNLDGEVNALDVTIMVRNLANWSDYKTMPYLHDYNDYINYREPLKNSYTKLTEEKSLTVAYLGGSITLGRSYENNCWRTMFDAWLKEDYPTAEIKMIHAGIGGTGSSYGAYRVGHQVLANDPDLVFIEFAVNDNHFDSKYGDYTATKESVQEYYEAIIQQIYAHDPETDIVMVYVQTRETSRTSPATVAQEELAEYYNINSVYFGSALNDYIDENSLNSKDYIYDDIHPTDKGYEIMLKPLREMFVNNWGDIDETGFSDKVLPEKTVSAHDRKDAYMVLRDDLTYDASVWTKSEFGVKTTTPGATLSFSFTGDEVAVYTSVNKTAGEVEFRVDGGEWVRKSLCGPVVSEKVPLVSGLDYETHTFELRVPEDLTSGHTVNLRGILIN